MDGMMCSKDSDSILTKWKCAIQQCVNYTRYTVPEYESSYISVAPRTKFYLYVLFFTCSIDILLRKSRIRLDFFDTKLLLARYEVIRY